MILCSGLRCLNPAIGQCGDNGSGRMTGVPLKSEFLFFHLCNNSTVSFKDTNKQKSSINAQTNRIKKNQV